MVSRLLKCSFIYHDYLVSFYFPGCTSGLTPSWIHTPSSCHSFVPGTCFDVKRLDLLHFKPRYIILLILTRTISFDLFNFTLFDQPSSFLQNLNTILSPRRCDVVSLNSHQDASCPSSTEPPPRRLLQPPRARSALFDLFSIQLQPPSLLSPAFTEPSGLGSETQEVSLSDFGRSAEPCLSPPFPSCGTAYYCVLRGSSLREPRCHASGLALLCSAGGPRNGWPGRLSGLSYTCRY